jgi:hypothetical protein
MRVPVSGQSLAEPIRPCHELNDRAIHVPFRMAKRQNSLHSTPIPPPTPMSNLVNSSSSPLYGH